MSRSTDGDRRRRIYRETLALPIEEIERVATEVQKLVHTRAKAYAGVMPGLDAEAYLVWRDKMEAYSFMVSRVVAGREEP
jgi:hypothetical protein